MSGKSNPKYAYLRIRADYIICMLFVVTTLLVYFQVGSFDFIDLDDTLYITDNIHVREGITLENIKWAVTTNHGAFWIPVTWLSHMVDCHLYGLNAGQHHLMNVLFHLLNTILLFLFFRQATGKLWQSCFVAALFALHPLHVESVAWVAERKDVLSSFFLFLTLNAYRLYVRENKITYYLLSLMFFVWGLMAKPMIVTLPFVLLLIDYWPLKRLRRALPDEKDDHPEKERGNAGILVLEKVPFLFCAVLSAMLTFVLHLEDGSVASLNTLPLTDRFANALVSYAVYIVKMFLPFDLAVLYPFPKGIPLSWVFASFLLLAVVSISVFKSAKSRPYFIVGWLWYLGTLVPVIGVLHAGLHARADRFTYVPLIGLFIILAWGIPELFEKFKYKKIVLFIAATSAVVFLSIITYIQIGYWSGSIPLFKHTLDVTADNYLINHNLNVALRKKDRYAEADKYLLEALRIRYGSKDNYPYIKGISLVDQGRYDEAIKYFSELTAQKPDSAKALINMGNALSAKGRLDEAAESYLNALKIQPDSSQAKNNLGLVFLRKGKFEDAIIQFKDALTFSPDYADAKRNLKKALSDYEKITETAEGFLNALKIDPESPAIEKDLKTLSDSKYKLEKVIGRINKSLSIQRGFRENEIKSLEKLEGVQIAYERTLPLLKMIIQHRPDIADTYYHMACIYSLKNEKEKSTVLFEQAIENGFSNLDLFLIDKDLSYIKKSQDYGGYIVRISRK